MKHININSITTCLMKQGTAQCPSHKGRLLQVPLTYDFLALSNTPTKAARTRTRGQCVTLFVYLPVFTSTKLYMW